MPKTIVSSRVHSININTSCGFSISSQKMSLRSSDSIIKLHRKRCEICKNDLVHNITSGNILYNNASDRKINTTINKIRKEIDTTSSTGIFRF